MSFAALVVVAAALATGQNEETSREADMFGDAPAETATTAVTSTVGDEREKNKIAPAGILGGGDRNDDDPFAETTSDREVAAKLETANDPFDIGAFIYLRAQYSYAEGQTSYRQPFTSSNLLDLYIDGRPSDRLRAFAQGRLYYNPTAKNAQPSIANGLNPPKELEPLLDQLWLKLDIARALFITLGRQRIKWGSGRAWNPTDFLTDVRDPLDIFDARIGKDLIKLHYPIESLGWNFYAVGQFSGADTPEKIGGAIRGEFVVGPAELALSGAAGKDQPIQFGVDLSSAIGPLDVHSELAVSRRVTSKFFEGTYSLEMPFNAPMEISRRDDFIVQWVNGVEVAIQYSDQDSIYVGGEYFFNDAGYANADLYLWLVQQGAFTPFYLGRHYAAVFASLPSPGEWNDTSFTFSAIANLSDRSGVARLDYQTLLLSYLRFNAFAQVHGGENGEFHFSVDVPPAIQPLLPPALQGGLAAPVFSVGLGVSIEI